MSIANPNRIQAVQCRTMPSQRPCDHPACTRPECSRARLSAEVFATALDDAVSAQEPTEVQEHQTIPESFTEEDLRLIKAMCETANPWYPERPMFPAWESVYRKASAMLSGHGMPEATCRVCSGPMGDVCWVCA